MTRLVTKVTTAKTIRVLTADDQMLVHFGVAGMVREFPEITWVGEAYTADELLSQCRILQPDVVILDVDLPPVNGSTAAARLRREFPRIQVLALVCVGGIDSVTAMLEAGAIGYLYKTINAVELVEAIRMAAGGRTTLPADAVRMLLNASHGNHSPGDNLTERERTVLVLLVKGLNNAEIARTLSISQFTVKNHVSSIFAKLCVTSRVEAAAFAIQHRLV